MANYDVYLLNLSAENNPAGCSLLFNGNFSNMSDAVIAGIEIPGVCEKVFNGRGHVFAEYKEQTNGN